MPTEKSHSLQGEKKPTEHFHSQGGANESIAESKWKFEGMVEKNEEEKPRYMKQPWARVQRNLKARKANEATQETLPGFEPPPPEDELPTPDQSEHGGKVPPKEYIGDLETHTPGVKTTRPMQGWKFPEGPDQRANMLAWWAEHVDKKPQDEDYLDSMEQSLLKLMKGSESEDAHNQQEDEKWYERESPIMDIPGRLKEQHDRMYGDVPLRSGMSIPGDDWNCPWCKDMSNTRAHNLFVHGGRKPIGGWMGDEELTPEEFDAISQPTPEARERAEMVLDNKRLDEVGLGHMKSPINRGDSKGIAYQEVPESDPNKRNSKLFPGGTMKAIENSLLKLMNPGDMDDLVREYKLREEFGEEHEAEDASAEKPSSSQSLPGGTVSGVPQGVLDKPTELPKIKEHEEFPNPDNDPIQNALLKLMKAPREAWDEPDELGRFAEDMNEKVHEELDKQRHPEEWKDPHPSLGLLPLDHPRAKLHLDEPYEREDGTKVRQPNVNYHAYNYLDQIQRDVPMTARKHLQGMQRVEYAKQYQQHLLTGEGVPSEGRHLDKAKTVLPGAGEWVQGRRQSPEWIAANRKEMSVHDFLKEQGDNLVSHLSGNEQAINKTKQMFDSISRESPSYKPKGAFETDPDMQQYFSIEQSLLKMIKYGSFIMKLWPHNEDLSLKGFEEGSKGHEQVSAAVQAQPHNVMYTAGLQNHSAHQGAPIERAANYLMKIRSGNEDMDSAEHVLGHQAIADIAYNIPRFGKDYATHKDAIKYGYIAPYHTRSIASTRNFGAVPAYPWHYDNGFDEDVPGSTEHLLAGQLAKPKSLEEFQRRQSMWKHTSPARNTFLTPAGGHKLSNQAYGMMDDLHRRIRMESPSFNPDAVVEPLQWPLRGMERQRDWGSEHGFVERVPMTEEAQEQSRELGEGRTQRAHEIFDTTKPGTEGFRWGPRKLGPTSRERWPLSRHGQETRDTWGESGIHDDAGYEDVMSQSDDQGDGPRLGQDEFEWTTPEERAAAYRAPDVPPPSVTPSFRSPSRPSGPQPHEEVANAFERKFPHLFKEGDGGGAAGVGGTVFTSSNAGIFTPTFGGSGVRRIHRKNKRKNDKKRRKLMGKDKKNGVDRLVNFLREGSPKIKKGVDRRMDGMPQGPSAAGNRVHNVKQIDWKKRQEGISKVVDHPTMGTNNSGDGKMVDASIAASYPSVENPTTGAKHVNKAPDWNERNFNMQKASPFQKASSGGQQGIGPPTSQNTKAATGPHPQAAFTEQVPDHEKTRQVVVQNDVERKIKQHDNKEDEPSAGQDGRTAMATKGMGDYPNSSMQMMEKEWGSGPDSFAQDDLNREADEWFPNEESVKSEKEWAENFRKFHKSFIEKGEYDPMISALLSLDNE